MSGRKPLVILDGGMSRELMRINAPFQQPEWSAYALMQAPETVRQIHEEFIVAGADMITTNSYALVPFHIGEERFQQRGLELAELAGRVALEAAQKGSSENGRKILVAGSLPPIYGSYRPDLFHEDQVQDYLSVLVEGLSPYVDIWLGETLSLIAEAKAVRTAIKDTGKPVWISFTIADSELKPTASLRSGESVAEATRWALESGVEALLFNCSPPEFMCQALDDAKAVLEEAGSHLLLGVYANGFVKNSEDYAANEDVSAIRDDLDAQKYASYAQKWVDHGATIIGGCCGIGCYHIEQVGRKLRGGT